MRICDERCFLYGEEDTLQKVLHLFANRTLQNIVGLSAPQRDNTSKNFFKYMQWNADHRCVICKTLFSCLGDFINHSIIGTPCSAQIHQRDKNKSIFTCPPCEKSFKELNSYLRHIFTSDYHGDHIISNIPKRTSKKYKKLIMGFIKKGR